MADRTGVRGVRPAAGLAASTVAAPVDNDSPAVVSAPAVSAAAAVVPRASVDMARNGTGRPAPLPAVSAPTVAAPVPGVPGPATALGATVLLSAATEASVLIAPTAGVVESVPAPVSDTDPVTPPVSVAGWTLAAAARREIGQPTAIPDWAASAVAQAEESPSDFIATISLPISRLPLSVAVSPDGARAYVSTTNGAYDPSTNSAFGAVSVINTATNEVAATIGLPPGAVLAPGTTSVAFSPDGARAYLGAVVTTEDLPSVPGTSGFSVSGGAVFVIDTAANEVISTIELPADTFIGPAYGPALAVSPDGTRVYVNTYDIGDEDGLNTGAVSVIDTATNTVTGTIALPGVASGLTLNPEGTRAYVATRLSTGTEYNPSNVGAVSVINTATNAVIATIPLSTAETYLVAVAPNRDRAYVAGSTSGTSIVSVIDTATNRVIDTVALPGTYPLSLALSADGNRASVAAVTTVDSTFAAVGISVIDTTSNEIVDTVAVALTTIRPSLLSAAVSPNGTRAYFTIIGKNLEETEFIAGVYVVAISAPNSAPVAALPTVGAPDPSTGVVTGVVNATDSDGDPLTFSAPSSTSKGTVSINAGTGAFSYTPDATARHDAARVGAPDSETTDAFTVTVTDGHGGSVTVPVSVQIGGANAVPVATAPTVGDPNSSTGVVNGSVSATDPDSDPLTYSGPSSTSKGSISLNARTGAFSYTPTATARQNAGKSGASDADKSDAFAVTVSDGYGGSAQVMVDVVISPVAQPVEGIAGFFQAIFGGIQAFFQSIFNALAALFGIRPAAASRVAPTEVAGLTTTAPRRPGSD